MKTESRKPERERLRHPAWLKVRAPLGKDVHNLKRILASRGLHTVCEEARCPNMGECWHHGTATFMILGSICTRGCKYCAVTKGTPEPLDPLEPEKVASAVAEMNLTHALSRSWFPTSRAAWNPSER